MPSSALTRHEAKEDRVLATESVRRFVLPNDSTHEIEYDASIPQGAAKAQRYGKTSLILTTNLSLTEWSGTFGDSKMTTALSDCLTHRCDVVDTGNESFRSIVCGTANDAKLITTNDLRS